MSRLPGDPHQPLPPAGSIAPVEQDAIEEIALQAQHLLRHHQHALTFDPAALLRISRDADSFLDELITEAHASARAAQAKTVGLDHVIQAAGEIHRRSTPAGPTERFKDAGPLGATMVTTAIAALTLQFTIPSILLGVAGVTLLILHAVQGRKTKR